MAEQGQYRALRLGQDRPLRLFESLPNDFCCGRRARALQVLGKTRLDPEQEDEYVTSLPSRPLTV